MGSPTPILQAFLLADQIYQDRLTNKKVIAGVFFNLSGPKLPIGLPSCWAYACLVSVPPEFKFQLRLVDLSDHQVLVASPVLDVKHPHGRLVPHELIIQVPPIGFPKEGAYDFELLVDDQPLKGVRFTVALRPLRGEANEPTT